MKNSHKIRPFFLFAFVSIALGWLVDWFNVCPRSVAYLGGVAATDPLRGSKFFFESQNPHGTEVVLGEGTEKDVVKGQTAPLSKTCPRYFSYKTWPRHH